MYVSQIKMYTKLNKQTKKNKIWVKEHRLEGFKYALYFSFVLCSKVCLSGVKTKYFDEVWYLSQWQGSVIQLPDDKLIAISSYISWKSLEQLHLVIGSPPSNGTWLYK